MAASSLPVTTQAGLALRDIHLPAPITWWPVAPGWYVLVIMLLMGLVGIVYLLFFRKQQRVKREAQCLLKTYMRSYQQGAAVEEVCAQVSELLRRVAIYYYPQTNSIASLQGEAWLDFLLEKVVIDRALLRIYLLEKPYQMTVSMRSEAIDKQMACLFKFTQQWISRRTYRV